MIHLLPGMKTYLLKHKIFNMLSTTRHLTVSAYLPPNIIQVLFHRVAIGIQPQHYNNHGATPPPTGLFSFEVNVEKEHLY